MAIPCLVPLNAEPLSVVHPAHALLDATAWLIRAARRAMLLEGPRRKAGEWNIVRARLQDASDSCKMRLPIGGADYLDNFADEVRVLISLVEAPARRSLYAAIAMMPTIRLSMHDTVDTSAPTERTPTVDDSITAPTMRYDDPAGLPAVLSTPPPPPADEDGKGTGDGS